jgi:hypothetical protein
MYGKNRSYLFQVRYLKMAKEKQIEPLVNWKKARWLIVGLIISSILLIWRYISIVK